MIFTKVWCPDLQGPRSHPVHAVVAHHAPRQSGHRLYKAVVHVRTITPVHPPVAECVALVRTLHHAHDVVLIA